MSIQNNEYDLDVRVCSCCGAEEGKPRLVGDFVVKLHTVKIDNEEQLVCQSCLRKDRLIRKALGLVSFGKEEVKAKTRAKTRSKSRFNFLTR